MLDGIARLANRGPWLVVVAGLAFAALAYLLGSPVAGLLRGGGFSDPTSQSAAADRRQQQATGRTVDGEVVALVRTGADVRTSPAARSEVMGVAGAMRQDSRFKDVLTFYDTQDPAMVSTDGESTEVIGQVRSDADARAVVAALEQRLQRDRRVSLGGPEVVTEQLGQTAREDLGHAELLAFPLILLLALVIFRGPVAAVLPLLVGGTAISGTFLAMRLVDHYTPLSVFSLNLVTGAGLGLAIDYSLFMVSRFREELAASGDVEAAVAATVGSAGRTILFSALTVTAAMGSLLVFPERFLFSMAVGGMLTALMAAAIALLVLPAVLRLLGGRVNALTPPRLHRSLEQPATTTGGWFALARWVMRRPALVATGAAALMVALGLPFLSVHFTSVSPATLPASASGWQVDDALRTEFPAGAGGPTIRVVVDDPSGRGARLADLEARIGALPGVASVGRAQPLDGHTWLIQVHPRGGTFDASSQDVVAGIRRLGGSGTLLVGGQTAAFVDLKASLAAHLPIAALIVGLATMVLLFLLTGSAVLPVKAVLMNVLTLSAAFGTLVLVFQDGRFQDLLRYTQPGGLDPSSMVILFAVVFGLSTDYGVFLLARIREARAGGAGERESVVLGLGRTGRIVTSAALLFCVAVGAFATSRVIFVKEMGVGTAAGVALDASVIRAFLVPSLMALLGRWNWWAPRPLRWLHARIGLAEAGPPPAGGRHGTVPPARPGPGQDVATSSTTV